jgi:CheY-like chemotaxis protein
LIAEDHGDVRAVTRAIIESFGFRVLEAKDGYEALKEAKLYHPDLILMDVAMPGMNGITAASLIRKCENLENVPIVAVTAYGREYVGDAEGYGFDRVVQKPVDFYGMKDLLDKYLTH